MARAFTTSHVEAIGDTPLLPENKNDRRILLELFILEKALNDVEGELTSRSEIVLIPIRGVLRMMGASEAR